MKAKQFLVEVPHIKGVSEADWKEYIRDAVGGWKGQFRPDEPLFDLDRDQVVVKRKNNKRTPQARAQDTDTATNDALAAYGFRIVSRHASLGRVQAYRTRTPNKVIVEVRRTKDNHWKAKWVKGRKMIGFRSVAEFEYKEFSTSLAAMEWVWMNPGLFPFICR